MDDKAAKEARGCKEANEVKNALEPTRNLRKPPELLGGPRVS